MPSALFEQLIQQAIEREKPVIEQAYVLWGSMGMRDLPQVYKLASVLVEQHADFEDDINELGRRHGFKCNPHIKTTAGPDNSMVSTIYLDAASMSISQIAAIMSAKKKKDK
jgi:hypothetical protein